MRGAIENAQVTEARIGNQTSPIDERGRFAFHLDLGHAALVELEAGETIPLFVSPGDQVDLSARAPDLLASAEFAGANAHVNQFLAEQARAMRDSVDLRRLYALPDERLNAEATALETRFSERFDDFMKTHTTVHRDFVRLEPEAIRATWAAVRHRDPAIAARSGVAPADSAGGATNR